MLRIIAGEFKGYKLKSGLDRTGFRPTKDRVKESLFSILGDISGAIVLDLFAGSGNLGLEALSRGASHATLVENNFRQSHIINENASKLQVTDQVNIISQNVISFLKNCDENFDLVLADPPYQFKFMDEFVALLIQKFSSSTLVLESSDDYEIPQIFQELNPQIKIYGNTKLIIREIL